MSLSHIKLIVTDMDGTLLNSKGEVSPEFYDLFDKLRKKNILFAVASGRQYYSLTEKLNNIKDNLIFIAENGAIVNEKEEQLYIQPMELDMAQKIIKKVNQIGGRHLILCGKKAAYIEDTNPQFMEQFLKHYEKYEVVPDLEKVKDDEFLKVTICDLSGAETHTYPQVKHFEDAFQVKLSGEIWIDFTHKKAQKGNALKKIQELKGITSEETIAFGDYLNDIEMFEHAGLSYAMENAHKQAKNAAKYSTKSNDERGVEYILEKLLKELESKAV